MRLNRVLTVLVLAAVVVSSTEAPTTAVIDEDEGMRFLLPGVTLPTGPEALAKGAVRWIPDPECGVFQDDGWFHMTDCRNAIATYSANGNAMITVRASGVQNETGEVVRWGPYNPGPGLEWVMEEYFDITGLPLPCLLLNADGEQVFTVNWSAQVTPSGHGAFTCHYKDEWAYQGPDQ